MKESVILVQNGVLYKNKYYDEIRIKKIIGQDVEFIILEEKLLIKMFQNIGKVKEKFIKKIIEEEYGNDKSILTHYEFDKKNKNLYLYSLGNGDRVLELSENIKKISILPIQFYIKNLVDKKIKKAINYICFIKLNKEIYYIKVINNFIVENEIQSEDEFMMNIYENIKNQYMLIFNKEIIEIIPKDEIEESNTIILDIGENLSEEILQV